MSVGRHSDARVYCHLPSSMFEMAPSIFSSSLKLTRLISSISTFKSPISSGRMMSSSSTTLSDLNNPSPCLMLPPTLESGGGAMIYNFYNLAQNKVISFDNNKIPGKDADIVGSSHGWLALFNEYNDDVILTNPVTRRHVKLPPYREEDVSKVIISCDAEQDECQAMMIDDLCHLFSCRPGRSPTEWTHIGAHGRCYEDIVYSSRHKLFFCVTKFWLGDSLEGWDVASDPPRLRWENRDDLLGHINYNPCLDQAKDWWCERYMYLVFVEQTDQLFLVMRHLVPQMAPDGSGLEDMDNDIYPYKTVAFDVYKIERELEGGGGGLMSRVDGGSLGGLAMFVGLNHSFAVSATEANGLKPNSIYFTDEKELTQQCEEDSKYGGHDIGIFDCENKTFSPCYYPCDLQSYKKIVPAPIWFTPTHN